MHIVNLLLSILVLLLNGCVFALFSCGRSSQSTRVSSLSRNPSNRLLHSLSLCDFLIGIGVIFHILVEQAVINPESRRVRITGEIFTTFIIGASILNLLTIIVDRAVSIFEALRYKNIVTYSIVKRLIIFIWLLPLFTSCAQLAYLFPFLEQENVISTDVETKIANIEMWYSITMFILYMLLPCSTMGVIFLLMFREVQRILMRSRGMSTKETMVVQKQKRVALIFSTMYLCFLLFSMPHFTFRVYLDIKMHVSRTNVQMDATLLNVFYTMKTFTSVCNPLIYTLMNTDFRKELLMRVFWFKNTHKWSYPTGRNHKGSFLMNKNNTSNASQEHSIEFSV